MYRQSVTIQTKDVLQAREARSFTKLTNDFKAQSWIDDGDQRVNAKSMIGVLSLDIFPKDQVTLIADGEDEVAAVEAMTGFLTKEN